jgi:hypothetical protein
MPPRKKPKKKPSRLRGNRNAAKPPELHRVVVQTRVARKTFDRLQELAEEAGNIGRAIDSVVERDRQRNNE